MSPPAPLRSLRREAKQWPGPRQQRAHASRLLPLSDSQHRGERWLRLELAVEQQRMILRAAVVQPRMAVVDAPERHAVDLVAVLHENLEDVGVALGKCL